MSQGSRENCRISPANAWSRINRFESLLRCRTPQDLAAVQSEFLRDNFESFLECARRISETLMQMADEATKRTAEAERHAQTA